MAIIAINNPENRARESKPNNPERGLPILNVLNLRSPEVILICEYILSIRFSKYNTVKCIRSFSAKLKSLPAVSPESSGKVNSIVYLLEANLTNRNFLYKD